MFQILLEMEVRRCQNIIWSQCGEFHFSLNLKGEQEEDVTQNNAQSVCGRMKNCPDLPPSAEICETNIYKYIYIKHSLLFFYCSVEICLAFQSCCIFYYYC